MMKSNSLSKPLKYQSGEFSRFLCVFSYQEYAIATMLLFNMMMFLQTVCADIKQKMSKIRGHLPPCLSCVTAHMKKPFY